MSVRTQTALRLKRRVPFSLLLRFMVKQLFLDQLTLQCQYFFFIYVQSSHQELNKLMILNTKEINLLPRQISKVKFKCKVRHT